MSIRIKFAELEKGLGEEERARAIFEMAVNQPLLDMPELLWKAYIGKNSNSPYHPTSPFI